MKETKKLKRAEVKPKETKVNGKAEFDADGKLVKVKKTAEEQIKELDQKDPKKQAKIDKEIAKAEGKVKKSKKSKTAKLDDETSPIVNFNRCQSKDARKELTQIYNELIKWEGVDAIAGSARTGFKVGGRSVGRLFPQTDGWSAYAGSNVEKRHWDSVDEYLESCKLVYDQLIKKQKPVKKGKGESKPKPKTNKPKTKKNSRVVKTTTVDELKTRIEHLSKGSKAVHLSAMSAEVEAWVSDMGYQVGESGHGFNVLVK